ncbi:MAG TPA: electron transfer flavoprotein subunit beta/FixA family protein, partial [Candidatus Dormibacteraeota bacterium]|nr:electron transfer flavoprotein subunit beta/FixA family protein [Candidatus Dormibacteraeota bacterium]
MNVVVCVKQVPDPNSVGQLDPSTHNLRRDGVEVVLDPGDEFGIEAGLQLADAHGGKVTVVSMAPERGLDAIRKALAMGAAKGVLVSDPSLAGADALTTAKVLAAAIRREGFDLVITATESTDGYTGVVPQALAEYLGVP